MFNRFFKDITSRTQVVRRSKAAWAIAALVSATAVLVSASTNDINQGSVSVIPQAQAAEALPQSIEAPAASAKKPQIDPMNEEDASFSLAEVRQKKRLIEWIANHYRIPSSNSDLFVTTAYKAAFDLGLDPHLILAIMAIESRFNPNARGAGGANGLMQVVTHIHTRRFQPYGGVKMAMDPVVNIKVGAQLLKDLIKMKGSVEGGVRAYAGGNGGYNSKVMVQYRKMKSVATGGAASPLAKPAKAS